MNYPLIPLSEIDPEARDIAVEWCKYLPGIALQDKHKLASDIMNYAKNKYDKIPADNN